MPIETDVLPLKYRRTKIVATLGPSSTEPDVLTALVDAGVDVFRLNMSHGTHETHRVAFERVRRAADARQRTVGVLVDLSGPKMRVGTFEGGRISLARGGEVTVTTRDVRGRDGLIPSQYGALARDVKPGDRILLDDGTLELEVVRTAETDVVCVVRAGGELTDHKGMNLPGVALSIPSLTSKDRDDARFALELGCDLVALSFVRRAADVEELRALMSDAGGHVPIIAKIERPEALSDIDAILDATDGIMVARGDLGVELPPQSVPFIQIQLTDLARTKAKPVIVATQMLESMVSHSRPTRAEVSDVALAVRSGADAVMLSAESAIGKFPVEAVTMMDTVARKSEAYLFHRGAFRLLSSPVDGRTESLLEGKVEDAMARAMSQLSRDLRVRAIHVISRSGRTTAVMSSSRPAAPIVATSSDPGTCRRAGLLWGVIPELVGEAELEHPQKLTRTLALKFGFGEEGQKVLLVRGFGTDPRRDTPSITVVTI
ncbi:MAG TPA: pyruvate kinase [Vicinamibacteria bacterium]|nr:pyruvate kinase [Vicinamibacteria bacterium]